jgi:hypothetical protein
MMPRAAPVMKATLPLSLPMTFPSFVSFSCGCCAKTCSELTSPAVASPVAKAVPPITIPRRVKELATLSLLFPGCLLAFLCLLIHFVLQKEVGMDTTVVLISPIFLHQEQSYGTLATAVLPILPLNVAILQN